MRPEPVPTAESRAFWEGAAEGRLVLRRCDACGRVAPPLAPRCTACLSDALAPATLSGRVLMTGRTVLHIDGIPGRKPPATLVGCRPVEARHVELVAFDPEDLTTGLGPGAELHLGFGTEENGVRLAVIVAEVAP